MAEPEAGNADAAMDPPKIYELREAVTGALLDAYMSPLRRRMKK